VTNTYVNRLRTALGLQQATGLWTNGFGWDLAGRLTNVTSAAGAFGYTYTALYSGYSGRLVQQLGLPSGACVTNLYDPVARLLSTRLKNSGGTTLDWALYGYNTGNQRTTYTNLAGTYNQYTYDPIGQVAKADSTVEVGMLEHVIRDVLNRKAARRFAVLDPLKVVIENYPEGQVEEMDAVNNPEDPSAGTRKVPFSRELYIERDDFMENPPKKCFRLSVGREVRLRYAYIIKCEKVIKDAQGNILEIHCTYDPETKSGLPTANRKVKATVHWVSAHDAVNAEVRLYDRLFNKENPSEVEEGKDFLSNLNPNSLEVLPACKLEPSLIAPSEGVRYQFERLGYFAVDPDSAPGKPVFNRTVALRDSWAKIEKRDKAK